MPSIISSRRPTRAQLLRNHQIHQYTDYLNASAERKRQQPIEQNLNRGLPVTDDKMMCTCRIAAVVIVDEEDTQNSSSFCGCQIHQDETFYCYDYKLLHRPRSMVQVMTSPTKMKDLGNTSTIPHRNSNKTINKQNRNYQDEDQQQHEEEEREFQEYFQQFVTVIQAAAQKQKIMNIASLIGQTLTFARYNYKSPCCNKVFATRFAVVSGVPDYLISARGVRDVVTVKDRRKWEKVKVKVLFGSGNSGGFDDFTYLKN